MAEVRAVGLPENDSERRAIRYLTEHLPPSYTIFHNLELPARSGIPYEYDIIVIGPFAVYHIEVKGYGGSIRGNAYQWELDSGAIYKSPIPLANKKTKVLSEHLRRYSPLLEGVWCETVILLTDDRVKVRLQDPQVERVVHLNEAVAYLCDPHKPPVRGGVSTHQTEMAAQAIFAQFRPMHRPQSIGEYQIIETVGKNNLYTAFMACNRLIRIQSRFLIKIYSLNLYDSDAAQERHREVILRDANALLHLGSHPNIIRAYPPFPWQDRQIALPLEWIDGYTLRGIMVAGTPMDFAQKIAVLRDIAVGLDYAHQHGVIHRDVEPNNIMCTQTGGAKLVNFDCARVAGPDMQTIATRIGHQLEERYTAPEVWQNPTRASTQSDQYGLGIICCELLTGQTPYAHIRELFAARKLPMLPTALAPTLPPEVDEIVSRMCAFAPTDRYPTLAEVIEDLSIIG